MGGRGICPMQNWILALRRRALQQRCQGTGKRSQSKQGQTQHRMRACCWWWPQRGSHTRLPFPCTGTGAVSPRARQVSLLSLLCPAASFTPTGVSDVVEKPPFTVLLLPRCWSSPGMALCSSWMWPSLRSSVPSLLQEPTIQRVTGRQCLSCLYSSRISCSEVWKGDHQGCCPGVWPADHFPDS